MMIYQGTLQAGHLALLVDGENFQVDHAERLMEAVSKYGSPFIRRVYGKAEHIAAWDSLGFRLCPIRPGKNSADMLLCVQAMTFAHRDKVQTVVIASSDQDFTYLAEELREMGVLVIGMGSANSRPSFQKACTSFEVVSVEGQKPVAPTDSKSGQTPQRATDTQDKIYSLIKGLLVEAGKERKISVQRLGSALQQKYKISAKSAGAATWSKYLKKHPERYELTGAGVTLSVTLKT